MRRTRSGLLALTAAAIAVLAVAMGAVWSPSAIAGSSAGHRVIVVGLGGLRWSDISPNATPAMWRLAAAGSVGSLVTRTVHTVTCPDDAWLTLNAGRRAAEPPAGPVRCRPIRVMAIRDRPGRAQVAGMRSIRTYNNSTGYEPVWGSLAAAASSGGRGCPAIGPGAALALADGSGRVASYQSELPGSYVALSAWLTLGVCPLSVIDLGNLPPGRARSATVAAADRRIARIAGAAPPGAIIVLAGLGDSASSRHGAPHLRAIIVSGPGYSRGQLTSDATRQPGIVTITDLTPAIIGWLGRPVPAGLVGSPITSAPRGLLAAQVTTMLGQDTANQVYRSSVGWFFLWLGLGEAVVFALIALVLRGGAPDRVRRRVAWYTAAGAFGAGLPAGTFLAGLLPWGQYGHPATWLYGLGLGWAALIAAGAMTGPWGKTAFGPPGFVGCVTLVVIGIDVMTGSRLQIGAPFGLSLVEAGRLYGVGNNALGVYAAAGMITAAWAAVAVLRRRAASAENDVGSRRAALIAAGAVAAASVIASGWPGFGAKVGGTIAMVPAYLVLLAAIGGIRMTARRGLVIALSGVALVAVFAVIDYVVPAIGPSHLGGFVGQLVHGGAGGTLRRKFSSNLHSLTEAWYTPLVPVAALVTGLMLCCPGGRPPDPRGHARFVPGRMRQRTLLIASSYEPLLRPTLSAMWIAAILGWFADDSGVSVAAAALPVALPVAIVLAVRTANLPCGKHVTEREAAAGHAATGQAINLCVAGQLESNRRRFG